MAAGRCKQKVSKMPEIILLVVEMSNFINIRIMNHYIFLEILLLEPKISVN